MVYVIQTPLLTILLSSLSLSVQVMEEATLSLLGEYITFLINMLEHFNIAYNITLIKAPL